MKKLHLLSITLIFCILMQSPSITGAASSIQTVGYSSNPTPPPLPAEFDNIILMIGDGMSWGQINATKKWLGPSVNLTMEGLTHHGDIETYSLDDLVPDSAAAGTALATGNLTNNDYISVTPDGTILTTILEAAEALNKTTGLVTTTNVNHATPAVFSAHVDDRSKYDLIARQQLAKEIEVLLGGGMSWFSPYLGTASSRGYHIVENRTAMWDGVTEDYLLGLFAGGSMSYEYDRNPLVEPHIAEMTNVSLQILDRSTNGFFLMVEGGRIDHACHDNNINNTIGETIAFDEAVQVAYAYTQQNNRTLLIVTADHECGGLWVNMSNPVLEYQFTSTYHTDTPVPIFFYHNTTATLPTFSHLTDVGKYLFEAFGLVPGHLPLEFVDPPSDQLVEYGDSCYYQLTAFATEPIDTWWINDTIQFTIDGTGLIQNTIPLGIDDYGLEVNVNDTSGLSISATFTFRIRDTTAPSWVTLPANQVLESGSYLDYQLQATDLSGVTNWQINDTIHFSINTTGHITSTTQLTPGTYGLNVTASDPYDNTISATFSVTVQEGTQPPTPPPPTPPIPGFPFASIIIALTLSLTLILVIRRKTIKAR